MGLSRGLALLRTYGSQAMNEEPLHVRVAEALGHVPCGAWEHFMADSMMLPRGACEHAGKCYPSGDCPRYDTRWGYTGPLIEKYASSITEAVDQSCWNALSKWGLIPLMASGPTPLIAACNLVLLLREAGKL